MQKISTCLWFNSGAEEAAKFYTSIFKNSKMHTVALYPKSLEAVTGKKAGMVMTAEFEIEGQWFLALNGGPAFHINPSISFFVHCKTAEEVDALWEKLSDGGKVMMELGEYSYSKRYGWVADKFGVTWQITPTMMSELMRGKDPEKKERAMGAMLTMKKLDIKKLKEAYLG